MVMDKSLISVQPCNQFLKIPSKYLYINLNDNLLQQYDFIHVQSKKYFSKQKIFPNDLLQEMKNRFTSSLWFLIGIQRILCVLQPVIWSTSALNRGSQEEKRNPIYWPTCTKADLIFSLALDQRNLTFDFPRYYRVTISAL